MNTTRATATPRAVPATRNDGVTAVARIHEAIGRLFLARGLIAGASLLALQPQLRSTRSASLRDQAVALARVAGESCSYIRPSSK